MKMIKRQIISILFLTLLYSAPSFAVGTKYNGIFQTTPSFTAWAPLQNTIFNRDVYDGIGAGVSFSSFYDIDGNYIVPVGSTWTWYIHRIADDDGNPVNQLIGEYPITYLGEVGDCKTKWNIGDCSTSSGWYVWWNIPCASEGRYRLKVLFNGNLVDQDDFSPSRFKPIIADIIAPDLLQPELTGDTFASKAMLTIPAQSSSILIHVKGVAGNQSQCVISLPNTTVKLSSTILPATGGHTHFIDNNEIGSGTYTALNVGDIVDPEIIETKGTVIEGKTLASGLFFTKYTAGDLGVSETISVEARREASSIFIESKSEIVNHEMDIKAPNLVEMSEGTANGEFKFNNGTTCNHTPTARWVVPEMKSRLVILDALYKERFGHRLSFNDASTKFGGQFDNGNNAGRDSLCHKSHRRGNDIDINKKDENGQNIKTEVYAINNVAYKRLDLVTRKAKFLGLEKVVEGPIHYRYINY